MKRNRDYYEVLSVPRSATPAEIERAYRQLVSLLEPDENTSSDARYQLQELDNAFAVLNDPARRAVYDRTGFITPIRRERNDDHIPRTIDSSLIVHFILWLVPFVFIAVPTWWITYSKNVTFDTLLPFLTVIGGAAYFAFVLGLAIRRWRRKKLENTTRDER